jgi:hypothetical protein
MWLIDLLRSSANYRAFDLYRCGAVTTPTMVFAVISPTPRNYALEALWRAPHRRRGSQRGATLPLSPKYTLTKRNGRPKGRPHLVWIPTC